MIVDVTETIICFISAAEKLWQQSYFIILEKDIKNNENINITVRGFSESGDH